MRAKDSNYNICSLKNKIIYGSKGKLNWVKNPERPFFSKIYASTHNYSVRGSPLLHLMSSFGKKENPQNVGEGWEKAAGRVARTTVFFLFLAYSPDGCF